MYVCYGYGWDMDHKYIIEHDMCIYIYICIYIYTYVYTYVYTCYLQ